MKNICKNCKFWEVSQDFLIKELRMGVCQKIKMINDCIDYKQQDENYLPVLKESSKQDKAFVQDDSDYSARLITKESFGCNEFIEK